MTYEELVRWERQRERQLQEQVRWCNGCGSALDEYGECLDCCGNESGDDVDDSSYDYDVHLRFDDETL